MPGLMMPRNTVLRNPLSTHCVWTGAHLYPGMDFAYSDHPRAHWPPGHAPQGLITPDNVCAQRRTVRSRTVLRDRFGEQLCSETSIASDQ